MSVRRDQGALRRCAAAVGTKMGEGDEVCHTATFVGTKTRDETGFKASAGALLHASYLPISYLGLFCSVCVGSAQFSSTLA